jgi:hypothetical protein
LLHTYNSPQSTLKILVKLVVLAYQKVANSALTQAST